MASTTGEVRRILISEPRSGLAVPFVLLDQDAPFACEALWRLAAASRSWAGLHAMWTGPEISCPIAREHLPEGIDLSAWPHENETSHPGAGDLVLTPIAAGPPSPTTPFLRGGLDLGLFYGPDGRLFFPAGWLQGTVCAKIDPAHAKALTHGARLIRQSGACQLTIEQIQ